jgi:Carbohydrate esterase, sialic acid-specific acetylesterase
MRLSTWAAALLLGVSGCARASHSAPEPRTSFDVVLLVGQSNMAGRGRVTTEDRTPVPHVWMLDRTGSWVPAVEPMHFDKPTAGVGPGRAFGVELARASGHEVGLVPAAVGGSSITLWVPGAYDSVTRTHPYDDALRRVRLATQRGPLVAVLWHQGEADANPDRAPEYSARLRALIERLRSDLGTPGVPVLVGQLGQFRPWTVHDSTVDAAHREMAHTLSHVTFVSSDGLRDQGDQLHFDAASARELGRRFAAAYAAMRAESSRSAR